MALISLSDWLDRFGDAPAETPSPAQLDSLRFDVDEAAAPRPGGAEARAAAWRDRLRHRWSRAIWRLRRLPSGQA